MGWESESILLALSKTDSMLAAELATAMDMPKVAVVIACCGLAEQSFISALDPTAPDNRQWHIEERGRKFLEMRKNR
jgi:hypothetical protein